MNFARINHNSEYGLLLGLKTLQTSDLANELERIVSDIHSRVEK
jgi:hypothetical protein